MKLVIDLRKPVVHKGTYNRHGRKELWERFCMLGEKHIRKREKITNKKKRRAQDKQIVAMEME